MCEPVYEANASSIDEVRQNVLDLIHKSNIIDEFKNKNLFDTLIEESIYTIIPDNRDDFCSFKGFNTHLVVKNIAAEVIKEASERYIIYILNKF